MGGSASGREPWEPSYSDDDGDEQDFVVESGVPSFTRLLTRRQKLLRGGVALLVVVVTAFVLLGGPDATASLVGSLRQPVVVAAQVPMARVGALAAIRLPPGSATYATLQLSPAAGSAGGAYACWVAPGTGVGAGGIDLGALHVTVLDDGAEPWRAVSPPAALAAHCTVVADAANPRQALLAVYARTGVNAACALPDLYFTGDGGATWQAAVWPDPNALACTPRVYLVDGRIYATTPAAQVSLMTGATGAAGRLIVSTDQGRSWRVGDTGLGNASGIVLVGIRPGGRLLAETLDARVPQIGTLWESRDDGGSWRSLGKLPGANPEVYVSQHVADTANGGWGRLYLSAESLSNGVAGGSGNTFFATAYPGTGWSVLPSLPMAPVDDGSEVVGIASGEVGPGGLLYVTRAMTGTNDHVFTPQRAVWIWEPRRAIWLFSPVGLPANTLVQGASWSGTAMSLWITVIHQGIPPTVQIAALELTAQAGG